jgi:hypothetical protein
MLCPKPLKDLGAGSGAVDSGRLENEMKQALELLEKAAKEHPGHPLNHLFYSQALWDEGDEASLIQYKTEFALGEKLLSEGNWGYNKEPWKKEFDEFQQECGETGPAHQ